MPKKKKKAWSLPYARSQFSRGNSHVTSEHSVQGVDQWQGRWLRSWVLKNDQEVCPGGYVHRAVENRIMESWMYRGYLRLGTTRPREHMSHPGGNASGQTAAHQRRDWLVLFLFSSFRPTLGNAPWFCTFKNSGLPWWRSGWESACQCRGHGFEPWSGKIPHAAEQLGPLSHG